MARKSKKAPKVSRRSDEDLRFTAFFEQTFDRELKNAHKKAPPDVLPAHASWDRRAAYLLWIERGKP